jgi:hypothetical protein
VKGCKAGKLGSWEAGMLKAQSSKVKGCKAGKLGSWEARKLGSWDAESSKLKGER